MAIAILGQAIAGCLGSDGGDGGGVSPTLGATITDPANFSANDSLPHVHDYWNGQSSVVIFEDTITLVNDNPTGCGTTLGGVTGSDRTCQYFYPSEGRTVAPGTAWMNITTTWTTSDSTAGAKPLSMRYDSALRTGPNASGIFYPEKGSTHRIQTNEQMNDIAHGRTSAWRFFVRIVGPASVGADYRVNVKVEIFRGAGALPIAPPHPDFWGPNQTLLLSNVSGLMDTIGGRENPANPGKPMPGSIEFALPPRLVPFETESLRLTFYYNSSTPTSMHYQPQLLWKGADRYNFNYPPPKPVRSSIQNRDGFYVWELKVEPRMWDSPYANGTSWAMQFQWVGEARSGWTYNVGSGAMQGDFHYAASVFRQAPAA